MVGLCCSPTTLMRYSAARTYAFPVLAIRQLVSGPPFWPELFSAGWTPTYATSLSNSLKAVDVADLGDERGADGRPDPGDRLQPPGELAVEEAGHTRLSLGKLLLEIGRAHV